MMIREDFNVILNAEEKLGVLPVTHQETMDFSLCIITFLQKLTSPKVHILGEMAELRRIAFSKG